MSHYSTLKSRIDAILADSSVRSAIGITNNNQIIEGATFVLVRGINKGRLPVIQWWITDTSTPLGAVDMIDNSTQVVFRIWTNKVTLLAASDPINTCAKAIQVALRATNTTGLDTYENVSLGMVTTATYGYYADLSLTFRMSN